MIDDMMRKLLFFFACSVLAVALFCSCGGNGGKQKSSVRRTAGSAPYELLLVTDKDWLKGMYGSLLTDVVMQDIPGLPQSEPNFRLTSINPADFNNTFKVFANILVVDISSKYKKAGVKIMRNVHVNPQLIITMYAPNNETFVNLLSEQGNNVVNMFVNEELGRERDYLRSAYSGKVLTKVKQMFGCQIYAPKDLNDLKTGLNFLWATSEGRLNNLNMCFYSYPYTSDSTFTLNYFVEKRDSFMMVNLQGEHAQQYMSLDRRSLTSRYISVDGHFVQEVRGLWQMENDMMGGPFVSYSQVDTINNRVIVAEGFVYLPNKKKRELIRMLEASLQTLKLPASR